MVFQTFNDEDREQTMSGQVYDLREHANVTGNRRKILFFGFEFFFWCESSLNEWTFSFSLRLQQTIKFRLQIKLSGICPYVITVIYEI